MWVFPISYILFTDSQDELKVPLMLTKKGPCWLFMQAATLSASSDVLNTRCLVAHHVSRQPHLAVICRFSSGDLDICKGLCWKPWNIWFLSNEPLSVLQKTIHIRRHAISMTLIFQGARKATGFFFLHNISFYITSVPLNPTTFTSPAI